MNLLMLLKEKKFARKMAKQRYKRGYADEDCWGMNYWLTETFPKMILHLRDMKNGAPELPFEEFDTLPEDWKKGELASYKELVTSHGYEYKEDSIFTKWYVILTRIAYCLIEAGESNEIENKYEDEYRKELWGDTDVNSKDDFFTKYFVKQGNGYILKTNDVNEELKNNYFNRELEIAKYKESMKDEAMDLIKKYFYNLWD